MGISDMVHFAHTPFDRRQMKRPTSRLGHLSTFDLRQLTDKRVWEKLEPGLTPRMLCDVEGGGLCKVMGFESHGYKQAVGYGVALGLSGRYVAYHPAARTLCTMLRR